MDIKDKKVLIVKSAASGIGAAKLALSQKAQVSLYDQKSWEQYGEEEKENLEKLKEVGAQLLLGIDIMEQIERFQLVIMSPGIPMDLPFVIESEKNRIPVIGEFEFAFQNCVADVVAITGTNGKTTTTSLVGNIVKAHIPYTYVVGNIGRPFSEDVMTINKGDAVIAEVSSFQLESISKFCPVISSVLNIEQDHLNRHKTMENYINTKKRIFENQKSDDFIVLNHDDPHCVLMAAHTKAMVIWFSSTQKVVPGVYLEDGYIIAEIGDAPQKICHQNELQILGQHNVENALAAVAITRLMKVPTTVIKEQLKAFKAVAHRIEYVGNKNGIDFFNDSKATNPDAAIKGLLAMNKKVRLIAGGLDKSIDFEEWTKLFPEIVACAYIIGESKKQLVETLNRQNFKRYKVFETFENAVYKAYKDAQKGECVLLSPGCASWDMFKSYEERGDLFKEIFQSLKE